MLNNTSVNFCTQLPIPIVRKRASLLFGNEALLGWLLFFPVVEGLGECLSVPV